MPTLSPTWTRSGGSSSPATSCSLLPKGANAPDWAAKIHIAVAPVYYHTYLYGAIVASQINDALRSAAGGLVDRPEAGSLLREKLFAPGSLDPLGPAGRAGFGTASLGRLAGPRSRGRVIADSRLSVYGPRPVVGYQLAERLSMSGDDAVHGVERRCGNAGAAREQPDV